MNMRIYHNGRNEAASTDGARWWIGTATDETSAKVDALQPVSELFPPPLEGSGVVPPTTVAKARAAFIASLRGVAPSVAPADDAERAVLRRAWDDAQEFARGHKVVCSGLPVFSRRLMVVGTADALVGEQNGSTWTYCYAPEGAEWRAETNFVVHLLHAGFPVDCADDPRGRYDLRQMCRAVLALMNRDATAWAARYRAEMPF